MADHPKQDVIALVGGGHGGEAVLSTLLKIPGIVVREVVDVSPSAPAIALARKQKIPFRSDGSLEGLRGNGEIDLILEVTGKPEVFRRIREIKHPDTAVISATGMRILWHLIDAQRKVTERLELYKGKLEQRILERTEEIERANRELEEKIVQYEKLNQELIHVNEEKTKYLLLATHHLKAPFAAIQSYTDIILEGYTGTIEEQTRDIVEKIRTRCGMLSATIKDMLALANLRSTDREHTEMKEMSLNRVLSDLREAHAVIADGRKVRLVLHPPAEECLVRGNRAQVKALFSALIENAVNYSSEGALVEISTEKVGKKRLAVSVRDQGIGISKENRERIFNDYFRANEAVAKNENGSGLGLAIVREVAQLHDFTVEVESEPGRGSTFTVTVPLAQDN